MNASLRPRGVIFDMDGLLLNTESLRMQAVEDCARELGVQAKTDLFAALIGGADAAARAALDAHMRADLPPDFWKVYRRCVERRMDDLKPMPGAIELLDHLERRDIPRALATSATHESVQKYCAPFGLVERFRTIVARGDYAAPKPAPDAYLTAAARLGLEPAHCLALEDSYSGVRAASAAGMAVIMAPDVLPANDEMRGLCVAVVADLHEVIARLAA